MPPEDINKYTYKVMFPEEMLVLQQEIMENHPVLAAQLNRMGIGATLQEKIGAVAAYCGLLIDGYFSEADMKRLFQLMIEKLKAKSSPIWRLPQ